MNTQPEQPARKANRLAKTSLMLGIIGILPFAFFGVFFLFFLICYYICSNLIVYFVDNIRVFGVTVSIVIYVCSLFGLGGVITGIIALLQIKKSEAKKGVGIAITGIVLGILACFPGLIFLVWRY